MSSPFDNPNGFGSTASSLFTDTLRSVSSWDRIAGSRCLKVTRSSSLPTCLICLEPLSLDDFESGKAISLDCKCRGELALRHKACAVKWAEVKGDLTCDICKTEVKNLPEVTPRARAAPDDDGLDFRMHDFGNDTTPGAYTSEPVPRNADVVFDCIRVTWVAMIMCILFFEMTLPNALWTGILVGLAYTLLVRALYRTQLVLIQQQQMQQRGAGEYGDHGATPRHIIVAV